MFLSVYFNSIFVIINYFRYNKVVVAVLITGSFSNDDGDSNESVKKALVLLSKTTTNVKKKTRIHGKSDAFGAVAVVDA